MAQDRTYLKKKPNILLITSDQQHFNTIGAFNNEISTPNLNRLVKDGTTFTRGYCPNPTCTPSRASIITGKYPSQHGAWTLGTKLPESENTIGHVLQESGYKTALIGKAHFQPLASTEEYTSLESYPILQDLDHWRNFDNDFYGFQHVELTRNHTSEAHVGQHYAIWLEENGCDNWRDYFCKPTGKLEKPLRLQKDTNYKWDIPEKYHYDAWIAERTNSLMDEYTKKDEPFFLWASFFDPHYSQMAPEPWDTMYDPEKITIPSTREDKHEKNPPHFKMTQEENPDFSEYMESGHGIHGYRSHVHDLNCLKKQTAVYYEMISLMDKYIGKILDKLDELGITEETIIVFTTDHGDFFGHHGLIHKGAFHYEDMIKIPFIVKYPKVVPAGKTSTSMQSLVDLSPTFLSLAGIKIPNDMTGLDQSQVWMGNVDQVRDHIICENHHEPTTIHVKTYVDERYKLTVYYNKDYGELYDLADDPNELNNLWDDKNYSQLKSVLLLKYIWAEMGKEPMWMPRIAKA